MMDIRALKANRSRGLKGHPEKSGFVQRRSDRFAIARLLRITVICGVPPSLF